MPPQVSIIIPACNEERTIGSLVETILQTEPTLREVIVVDDASTDRTAELAREAGARVIQHPYNMGNGAAVKTGIRNARGAILVMMDGDGQHRPSDISHLLSRMDRYEMVVGAREMRWKEGAFRSLANRVFNALATYVTGRRIPDLTSGFRAIRGKAAKRYLYLLPNTFSYPSTLTLAMLKGGHPVDFVPIQAPPAQRESHIKPLRDGIRFLFIIMKISTIFSPSRIFLPVSIVFFSLGILYYLYTFLTTHRFTNMALLLLITGVLVFLLGLIAEQIAQLRMDRSEDP